MLHPTETTNAITPNSWFYSLYTPTPNNQNQSDQDQKFNDDQNDQYSTKNLTVADQTEVLVLHYVSVPSYTTKEDDSRQYIIPFVVAEKKHNNLGTPFFE